MAGSELAVDAPPLGPGVAFAGFGRLQSDRRQQAVLREGKRDAGIAGHGTGFARGHRVSLPRDVRAPSFGHAPDLDRQDPARVGGGGNAHRQRRAIRAAIASDRQHALAGHDAHPGLEHPSCRELHQADPQPRGIRIVRFHARRENGRHRRRIRRFASPPPKARDERGDDRSEQQQRGDDRLRAAARFRRCRIERRLGMRRHALDEGRFGYPAISVARQGEHPRLLRVVPDQAAQLADHLTELRVGDIGAAPDGGDQFVAPDRSVTIAHQPDEGIEHLRRRLQPLAVGAELARRHVEPEPAEAVALVLHPAGSAFRSGTASLRSRKAAISVYTCFFIAGEESPCLPPG